METFLAIFLMILSSFSVSLSPLPPIASIMSLSYVVENFDSRKFKLFLFNDEESFKRKIRLHLV